MRFRLVPILVTALLLVFAVSVAACGGDDGSGGVGSSLNDAKQKAKEIQKEAGLTGDCKKDAAKYGGDTKADLEKLCNAAKSGDTDKLRDAAESSCEKIAKQIPVDSERTKAIQDCKDSVK